MKFVLAPAKVAADGTALLEAAAVDATFFDTAVAAQAAPGGEAKLIGDWKLVKLGDEEAPKGAPITLSVNAEGKVSGSGGVNRLFGSLAMMGKLFGPLGMTRRAGPPEAMAAEAAFTKVLEQATSFTIKDGKLTLLVDGKPRLVFERQKPPKEEYAREPRTDLVATCLGRAARLS